ncbi:MAG TPA: hypothetical protein VGP57_21625 [Actinoplanes sp.]|nr:hypothetical protein [Actinoplanes sp.]
MIYKLAVAAVLALALAGCGDVGRRSAAATEVALRMLTAVDGKDGATACATLAPDTASKLQESAGKPCAEAILGENLPAPGTVTGADVYGQWAQVRLSDDTLFLGAFPGGWRVVAAGCTPRGERPYNCTLEGG